MDNFYCCCRRKGDYDTKGIPGIGKETACKFLNELVEYEKEKSVKVDVLKVIRQWSDVNYKGLGLSIEDKLRRVIMNNAVPFPNEDIIREYLNVSQQAKDVMNMAFFNNNEKWRRPHMMNFQVSNQVVF